jgi:hypothetical protein
LIHVPERPYALPYVFKRVVSAAFASTVDADMHIEKAHIKAMTLATAPLILFTFIATSH